ncbi:twin-arginine translocase TatA/TatE family subunit [uncultured Senegalimassilia sp.]|mgnify:CR=1 FL=1|uniref:twin-arginine translocase TatA/TatE family subunit n=1 Tax=Senegalimassilia faecalis TaxID=2509433 RepID=UPI0026735CB2|nr:twin-arginine translocase TatA/TatE family subunit [uncultured Senegalimassilia sp.]
MKFLGMGVPELLIILVVVLLIFGPKNLPKLGSAIGKSVKSLRDGMSSDEGKPEIELDEDEEVEVPQPKKKQAVKAAKKAPAEDSAE